MARRFFKGANAGFVGNTDDGRLMCDYFMVKMETEKRSRIFHVHESRILKLQDMWLEIKPSAKYVWNEEEGGWETKSVWEFEGKEISLDKLETRYEIVEVTNLVNEVSKLYILDGLTYSPYVSMTKCLEICYQKNEMTKKNAEDGAIIKAIEDYIKNKKLNK